MRKFLIILDDTPEMLNTVRCAAVRAARTLGCVELLAIIDPLESLPLRGVAGLAGA